MNTITDDNKTAVGICTHCNKTAQWNTPSLDHKGNLWCDGCVDHDRSGTIFRHINQFKLNDEYEFTGGVSLNGVIVWKDLSTWTEGGSRAVHLTETEKQFHPLAIAIIINDEHNVKGLTRCTGCNTKMTKDEIAGYPLFAGVCCAPCMAKHGKKLDAERKAGHVCGTCGKPYSACYC